MQTFYLHVFIVRGPGLVNLRQGKDPDHFLLIRSELILGGLEQLLGIPLSLVHVHQLLHVDGELPGGLVLKEDRFYSLLQKIQVHLVSASLKVKEEFL